MKYILGLAFEYKHYKKPVKIRTYADGYLIDELELSEDIRRKGDVGTGSNNECNTGWGNTLWDGHKWHEPHYAKYGKYYFHKYRISLCEKIFTYEIDDVNLNKHISIEVINDDNNYSNGFMSKFSWVMFDMVFLMPKKYYENLDLLSEEKPDVLGRKHRRSGIYDRCKVQDWRWPFCEDLVYDPISDLYNEDLEKNFLSRGIRVGTSFKYEFDLEEWEGMRVIKPKNVSRKFLNELYCLMNETFLTYYVDGKLINRSNENQ